MVVLQEFISDRPWERLKWQEIEDKYGYVDKLYPYEHYWNGWMREAGTTEDGVERQKLMITAIGEKKNRVTAEDIRAIWLRDIKDKVGYASCYGQNWNSGYGSGKIL